MIYAYIRVSTKQQNIDRQYVEIKEFGVEDKFIYVDKESGKDFDRTNYKKLIKKLKKDDLLIVKSIDRLGRNYHMILEEWAHITKTIGADIKVLDMPLLDTRIEGKNLVGKFISDIVLQVLSFVAENERINIKQRQMEGIRIAKEKGVKFGRPKVITPPNTNDILDRYISHEITNTEAASLIGVKDYNLTNDEKTAISKFKDVAWKSFNLENLYGKATRGKRLKSDDRIMGELPFVTAGEENEGVSDFIGNNVTIFNENTTTIDMFGSAKYRNYKYGGDDHIAVVHTENIDKYAAIFISTAIHKSSHNGQFSYDKNFYAKDADCLNIMLPVKNDKPDYDYMSKLISAIHKIVIEDVVKFTDERIENTKNVINNN